VGAESRAMTAICLLFSVQPLRSLCLCGLKVVEAINHRDTEDTEVAQRRVRVI
jgi:hypothetical protein